MARINSKFTKTALVLEDTKGVYKPPTNTDFLKLSSEGASMNKTRSEIVADFLDGDSITNDLKLSRIGESTWSLSTYLLGSKVLGQAPVYTRMYEAYGMEKKSLAQVTTLTGNTTSIIQIAGTDLSKFYVGQVIKLNEYDISLGVNKDHLSPIAAIIDNEDTTYGLQLLVPAAALTDEVIIEAQVNFDESDSAKESISITGILEGNENEQRLSGGIVNSLTLNNFGVDSLPSITASGVGYDFIELLNSTSFEPELSEGDLLLPEKIYIDGVPLCLSDFSFEMSRESSNVNCIGAKEVEEIDFTGKRTTSGAFTYYKTQGQLPFQLDGKTKRSIFFSQAEYEDVQCKKITNFTSFFIPEAKFITSETVDVDGKLSTAVGYKATPSNKTKGTKIVVG